MPKVIEVGRDYYHNTLGLLDKDKRLYVDEEVIADKYYLVFDGLPIGGFGTNSNGYLTGLFSLEKGRGREIFELRLARAKLDAKPGVHLNLFCIGDFLAKLYSEYGFSVKDTFEWDDSLAPKGWDYESKGRPMLYEMHIR